MTDILTDLDKKIAKLPKPQAAFLRAQLKWFETARLKQVPPSPSEQLEWIKRVDEKAVEYWLVDQMERRGLTAPTLDMLEEVEEKALKVQCLTPEEPWTEFGVQAGRGTGKSRQGAEWIFRDAWEDPQALPRYVVAPTQADVRFTCFEGESGLISIIPPECIENYNRSELVITLKNGAPIRGFSAEKSDRLRGPQAAGAWADEIAAWGGNAQETWDMMMFGLRLGPRPRVKWTSTPRSTPFVRKLTAPKKGRIIVRGATFENRENLADSFLAKLSEYEGTRLGRQEVYGELIDPEEAGIVRRSQFRIWPHNHPLPKFEWVILSVDTAFTEKTLDKKGDPDPTAASVWGVFTHERRTNILLLDCWEEHLGLPALVRRVKKEMSYSYGDDDDRAMIMPLVGSSKPRGSGRKPDILLIEDKGSGISLRQTLAEMGVEAHPFNPGRADKLARLHIVSPMFAQKRVWVPESMDPELKGKPRKWAEPLIDQLCTFAGEGSLPHDDFVDTVTQAIRFAVDNRLLEFSAEPQHKRRDREEEEFYQRGAQEAASNNTNPYAA